jgi:hypothetical protein
MLGLSYAGSVVGAILLADFLSGLVHWAEDSYFSPTTPLLGRAIQLNMRHEADPGALAANPWYISIRSSLACAAVLLAIIWISGASRPVWFLAAVAGVFANQIHKWAHTRPDAVPAPVRALQRVHILQSARHHAVHHRSRSRCRYCVMTEVLNPLLDRVAFWRGLEYIVHVCSGYTPRSVS